MSDKLQPQSVAETLADKIGMRYVFGSLHYSYTNVGMDVFDELYSLLATEARVWFFLRKHWPDFEADLRNLDDHPELRAAALGARGTTDEWFYENYVEGFGDNAVPVELYPELSKVVNQTTDGQFVLVHTAAIMNETTAEQREGAMRSVIHAIVRRAIGTGGVGVALDYLGTVETGDVFAEAGLDASELTTELWQMRLSTEVKSCNLKALLFGTEFVQAFHAFRDQGLHEVVADILVALDDLEVDEGVEKSAESVLALLLAGDDAQLDATCDFTDIGVDAVAVFSK